MKHICIITFFLMFVSCYNKPHKNEIADRKEVFSIGLKKEINKLIEIKNKFHYNKNAFCSIVLTKSNSHEGVDNQCVIITALTLGVDSSKISGYTFLGNEFIACYLLDDSCNTELINKGHLSNEKEVIKQYDSTRTGTYDLPSYVYKIANTDSLILIKAIFFH